MPAALLSLLLAAGPASAQFDLHLQIRPRTELRHGYGTLAGASSQAAIVTTQRSRLSMAYHRDRLSAGLVLQDVRVWGDEQQLQDVASAVIHEAWGALQLTPALTLKFGRQELVYDDHRLLGNVDWVQQARSHDAALLQVRSGGWKVDVAAAYNNEREDLFKTRFTSLNYRSLFFLWTHKEFGKTLQASFLALADGFQSHSSLVNDVVYRYTTGSYLQFNHQGLSGSAAFYYQFGTNPFYRGIDAYLLSGQALYSAGRFSVGGGVDFLSGSDGGLANGGIVRAFNTLYATNHKFYGWMDYFLDVPIGTAQGGLTDWYANFGFRPAGGWRLSADYHFFRLSNDVVSLQQPGVLLNRNLGWEVDGLVSYQFLPEVNIQAGYSVLLPGASMENIKGGDRDAWQNWAWLMITIRSDLLRRNEEK